MSILTHDLQHKAREAAQLPSVDEWVRNGGKVQRIEDEPRLDAVMAAHKDFQIPRRSA